MNHSTTAIPVDPKTRQLVREAKIGLTICALLIGVFFYVTWHRFSGGWNTLPENVKNAPLAQDMSEAYKAEYLEQRLVEQQGEQDHSVARNFNDPNKPGVVSKTVPKNDTPISFNNLRSKTSPKKTGPDDFQPEDQVKPVIYENDGNSFQPFRTENKPKRASEAKSFGSGDPRGSSNPFSSGDPFTEPKTELGARATETTRVRNPQCESYRAQGNGVTKIKIPRRRFSDSPVGSKNGPPATTCSRVSPAIETVTRPATAWNGAGFRSAFQHCPTQIHCEDDFPSQSRTGSHARNQTGTRTRTSPQNVNGKTSIAKARVQRGTSGSCSRPSTRSRRLS